MAVAGTDAEVRSEKGRRTRAKLIAAGRVVFARDGFARGRIADIAGEAGLSYGAFYHYFDSKEAIFREIAEETEVALLAIGPAERSRPVHYYERIRAANRSYLETYERNAGIMRVIEEVSRYDDRVKAVRDRHQNEFATRIGASIHRMQQSGVADPEVDGGYAATALGGMVATFAAALFADGSPFEIAAAVEQLTILWANALGLDRRQTAGTF